MTVADFLGEFFFRSQGWFVFLLVLGVSWIAWASWYNAIRPIPVGWDPPPLITGPPMLGCALSMGLSGSRFLVQCRALYGDSFTLRLFGSQRMTFIHAPEGVSYFFKAPSTELSFTPAVRQFTQRVFGLAPIDLLPKHHTMLMTLRHALLRNTLPGHAARLLPLLAYYTHMWEQVASRPVQESDEVELFTLVKSILFPAAVDSLFGPKFLARHGIARVQAAFLTFESCFEHAASPLPHLFQPTFRRSRRFLRTALTESLKAGDFYGTVVENVLTGCQLPLRAHPNVLLALLWASQANTLPAAFWSLAFLLLPENSAHLAAIRQSLGGQGGSHQGDPRDRLISMACDPTSLLLRCCTEAIRLRSPSIEVRVASQDIGIPRTQSTKDAVRQGDVVAICPWSVHADPRVFNPEPEQFNPDREGAQLPGVAAGMGGVSGVAFGGGRYRCPGKAFAEMELALVVGHLLMRFEFDLVGKGAIDETERGVTGAPAGELLPQPNMTRLVGVKVPEGPCCVRVRGRTEE